MKLSPSAVVVTTCPSCARRVTAEPDVLRPDTVYLFPHHGPDERECRNRTAARYAR